MTAKDSSVRPHLTPEGRFALWGILCEFASFGLLLFFVSAEKALALSLALMLLLVAMRTTWAMRANAWYWIGAAGALGINSELSLHLPLSNRAYRGLLLPFGILEFVIAWSTIKLICLIADWIRPAR